MIKHLPEGLTPFEDCGFARYPLYPLENEPFDVACRVDGSDAVPALAWRLNGVSQAPLSPASREGRYFRFRMSGFPYGAQVQYAFALDGEAGRLWDAPICRRVTLTRPTALYQSGATARLCFGDTLALEASAGRPLRLRFLARCPAEPGEPCDECALPLPGGFALVLSQGPSFCKLKRLSDDAISLTALQALVDGTGRIRRLTQSWAGAPAHVWGTGERFDAVDQCGRGANGRVVEKFTQQGDQTYLPMPFFMTDAGYGWYAHGGAPTAFSFADGLTVSRELDENAACEEDLFFGPPKAILAQYIAATGKPALPPEWSFGVWISANGWHNDAEVDAQLAALRQYDYPASVMVLEAWSDERTFYRWNADGSWRDPAAAVRRIREAGLHLLLWQIPIIKYEWDGEWGEALRADEREAIEKGYCVRNADGTPYRITENWFHNSLLLDFTNPEAVRWWFGKRQYLLDMGVEGFKTDGGEFLFDSTATLHDGTRGLAAHNLYPAQYVGAYHDFLRRGGVNGLTFSRAGYVGAQTQPMHWAGDQLSQWSELQGQLNAGLSAGLSGVLFWGFDIGGFAGELPGKELYLRATAMACFCPVMQWHAEPRTGQFFSSHEAGYNNDRSPWNLAEKLGDPSVLAIATDFARLRERLRPYLWAEAQFCVSNNRPMMAHLCLDYPEDAQACATDDEYLLGRRLLVAPLVREGQTERDVYLPRGQWTDFFTRQPYVGGQTYRVACDLTSIPVFCGQEAEA